MEKLSEITGGRFYEGETKKLKETFSLIAEELRHQYRLGFYPDELKRDGSVHALSGESGSARRVGKIAPRIPTSSGFPL